MDVIELFNQMKKFEKVLIFFPMYKLSCMHIRFLSANLRIVARDILLLRDDALVILSTTHAKLVGVLIWQITWQAQTCITLPSPGTVICLFFMNFNIRVIMRTNYVRACVPQWGIFHVFFHSFHRKALLIITNLS